MDHIEYMRQLGRASRASLSASQRKEQASKAARKRWGNANGSHTNANGKHIASRPSNANGKHTTCIVTLPNGNICNRVSTNHFGMSHEFSLNIAS